MYKEVNTDTNLPAQIELYATAGSEYHFFFYCQRGKLCKQDLPLSANLGCVERISFDRVPNGKDTDNRDRRLPTVSLVHSDRRAQCRNDVEDSKTAQH